MSDSSALLRLSTPALLTVCATALLLALVIAVGVGSVWISPAGVVHVFAERLAGHSARTPDQIAADAVIFRIRLPRVLLACVVGAALSVCGVVVQVLVRNALADPYLLGISSGASVGATAVLLFGVLSAFGIWALAVGGILGAAAAMIVVYLVAQRDGQLVPLRLLLCGVALASMFSAAASYLVFRGDPRAAQTVLFWLLGSFGSANWTQLPLPTFVLLASIVMLLAVARSLNAMALGPDVAASVGVDVRSLRLLLFAVTCVIAGASVAVAGVIGFVGLVVPHIVRLLAGSDHRRILPVSIFCGAIFTTVGDLLARTLVAPQEMPMGVVTAFIGAPVLIWLVRRRPHLYGGGVG